MSQDPLTQPIRRGVQHDLGGPLDDESRYGSGWFDGDIETNPRLVDALGPHVVLDVLAVLTGHARSLAQQSPTPPENGGGVESQMSKMLLGSSGIDVRDFPEFRTAISEAAEQGRQDTALSFGLGVIFDGLEALMDEEIHTIVKSKLAPYHSLVTVSEALPALGIVAAVLGVIKAMGALDQSPKLLGGFIGAALVGTFAGIFLSYGIISPFAIKIKMTREKKCRPYIIVKQTLLAFMNGAMPQIAVEHGRKMISSNERPSIDVVENETIAGPKAVVTEAEPKAAPKAARA